MPTSVLLAVLAAAGMLALAPALTRRYDATERVAAERVTSTARVLSRRRRRRTVPGPRPINAPRFRGVMLGYSAAAGSGGTARARALDRVRSAGRGRSSARLPRTSQGRRSGSRVTALHRRRRVFLALLLLTLVQLAGVPLVGSGFWVGFAASFLVLLADLVYLRRRAVAAARVRQARLRRARWVATEQAAVRREHDRRAAERVAALRRTATERDEARREAARRPGEYVERYGPRIVPGT